MPENKSWCPIPWIGVNIRNNGEYRVCCHANTSEQKGILKDEQGVALRADQVDIQTARNAGILREVRRDMLRGERHPVCVRCNVEDDSGVRSRRGYEKSQWKEFSAADAAALTAPDGSILADTPAAFFDLRFGNLCNLKCRMCGPTDSSAWYREHFENKHNWVNNGSGRMYLEENAGKVKVSGPDLFSWHESEGFWRDLEENSSAVKKIYVVGGEPLLIERHFLFLEKLVASGRAGQVLIEYNTNATVLPSRALSLWRHFREVRIGASIDGHGAINEYIRHPSKWPVVEKNLRALDSAEGNLKVWIAPTVQAYNVYYLPELIRWKMESGFRRVNSSRRSPFLTPHALHNPLHLSVKVLPRNVKDMVEKKFADFYEGWFLPHLARTGLSGEERAARESALKNMLGGYVSLMRGEDLSHLLPLFWSETLKMDLYRKEKFELVMPEIAEPIKRALA